MVLDKYSANFLFTLWKRVRKYGACCTGLTQNVDDLLQSHTAQTMLANKVDPQGGWMTAQSACGASCGMLPSTASGMTSAVTSWATPR